MRSMGGRDAQSYKSRVGCVRAKAMTLAILVFHLRRPFMLFVLDLERRGRIEKGHNETGIFSNTGVRLVGLQIVNLPTNRKIVWSH